MVFGDLECLGFRGANLVQGLENSISRVSRLIWALHLAFNDGVTEHFALIMSQQYPRSLLPELRNSCQVRPLTLALLDPEPPSIHMHISFESTPWAASA